MAGTVIYGSLWLTPRGLQEYGREPGMPSRPDHECSISDSPMMKINHKARSCSLGRQILDELSCPDSWIIVNHLWLDAGLSLASRGVQSPYQRYNQRGKRDIFIPVTPGTRVELPLNCVHCPDIFVILSDNVCPLVKGCLGYTFMT